jgi:hypothetical protein
VCGRQSWPSGLRRCVQVAVSSDAWVRTPQAANSLSLSLSATHLCTCHAQNLQNALVIRSYHGGNTGSHPNSEVKHHWACLVLRWGTTRESYVLNDFFFFFLLYSLLCFQSCCFFVVALRVAARCVTAASMAQSAERSAVNR